MYQEKVKNEPSLARALQGWQGDSVVRFTLGGTRLKLAVGLILIEGFGVRMAAIAPGVRQVGMAEDQALGSVDVQFVTDIQQGRTQAEAELYEKYGAKVYYVALRESRSPQDAEDVRAETFLRVLQAIRGNQLRSAAALPAFILGTTRNVLHELFSRRRQAGRTTEPEAAGLAMASHEKLFLDLEVQQAVEKVIVRLKPRERDLLRMHFFEELPAEEIARRSGIARERVRLVKSRALKRFREFYLRTHRETQVKKLDTQAR